MIGLLDRRTKEEGIAIKGNHEFLGEIKKMIDASINGAVESVGCVSININTITHTHVI